MTAATLALVSKIEIQIYRGENLKKEIVLFETKDKEVKLSVPVNKGNVWLNRQQMADLFDRDVKTIGKHINNALKEELDDSVVANFATTASDGKNL